MNASLKWIDTHVHLFPESADGSALPKMARAQNAVNTPRNYMSNQQSVPAGVVVVHFSKAADSQHVIDSLDAMKHCPAPKAGVIKADVTLPQTFEWIKRPDVKAVRVYAKESAPDFSDKAAWNKLWSLVRSQKKHVLVFGAEPYLRDAIRQIPQDLPLVIDHLGLPDVSKGANDPYWSSLLLEMAARNTSAGPVYYKGPGYRTSLDPKKVQPFVNAILRRLGKGRLMLGASDGPFAGPVLEQDARFAGKNLSEIADFAWINHFTLTLAKEAAKFFADYGVKESELIADTHWEAAATLYGFDVK